MSPNYENTGQKIGGQRRYVATAVIFEHYSKTNHIAMKRAKYENVVVGLVAY